MIQAIMVEPGKIEFKEIPIPFLNDNEVLVQIKNIGICGSDIHVYHGKHPYTKYPIVQGHEVSGEIAKIGSKVVGLEIGNRVTIQPQVVCGHCYSCTHNQYNICDDLKVMGFQTTGMASEYFLVDSNHILKLPDDMPFEHGALVEPMAVAVHALSRSGIDISDKKVLVLGAGPIGNLIAQTAKGMGARAVLITDLSDFRLDIAKECGIEYCINTGKVDLDDALFEYFGPYKADLILECVGANSTITQAISCARKGSDIVVVGVFSEKGVIDFGLVQDRELSIYGTLMYMEHDYKKAIDLINNRDINLDALITNRFSFVNYQNAYEYINNAHDQCMKVMIEL